MQELKKIMARSPLNTQIGRFALIAQTIRTPILDVPLLCDLDAERAASAFAAAGYADEDIVMADI